VPDEHTLLDRANLVVPVCVRFVNSPGTDGSDPAKFSPHIRSPKKSHLTQSGLA